ncbi:hypothetical protein BGZ72_008522, partial [Mortierella alpina]
MSELGDDQLADLIQRKVRSIAGEEGHLLPPCQQLETYLYRFITKQSARAVAEEIDELLDLRAGLSDVNDDL